MKKQGEKQKKNSEKNLMNISFFFFFFFFCHVFSLFSDVFMLFHVISKGFGLCLEDSAARRAFEMMIRGCARQGDLQAARRWYVPRWIES